MIKTLQVQNFKAFQDTGEIEIKPITVLAGPNSGGKSSILQSLLLLKQTLETAELDVALNLDGRFLQFSKFNELVFGKPQLRYCEIIYKIGFEVNMPTAIVARHVPNLSVSNNDKSVPIHSDMKFSFRYGEFEAGEKRVMLDRFDVLSRIQGKLGPHLELRFHEEGKYRVTLERIKLPKPFGDWRTLGLKHFLPYSFLSGPESGESEESSVLMPLDSIFLNPLGGLEAELKNHLKYVGPLREEPRRVYVQSANPLEISQRVESAAQTLYRERDTKVEYLPNLDQPSEEITLLDAVNKVFGKLEINQPISVRSDKSMLTYQILFDLMGSKSKKQVTIADVGFGFSQLLPIVLMGLKSEKESILLFEQPEIHLHPRLQANLADFLLRMALLGKRIIVETHSDHFINRLRRRIAEDETDKLKDKVNILFVNPPHDGQGATIDQLRVDRYGVIENWPPDFLPESANEAEAIILAGLEKRKGEVNANLSH